MLKIKQLILDTLYHFFKKKNVEIPKNNKIGILFCSAPKKNIPLGEFIIREPFFRYLNSLNNTLYLLCEDKVSEDLVKIKPFNIYFKDIIYLKDVKNKTFDYIINLQNYNFDESFLKLLKNNCSKLYSINYPKLLVNFNQNKFFDFIPRCFVGSRHELQRSFDIFGINIDDSSKYIPKINYNVKYSKPFDYVINVMSPKSTKHWLIKNIKKFIKNHKDKKIALIGDKYSIETSKEIIKNNISKNIFNFVGSTNINKLLKILNSSKVVITPDTGTAHLSVALGVKTIVLYGPTELNRWKPLGKNAIQIRKNFGCLDCRETRFCKKKTNECMDIDLIKEKI